MQRQEIKDKRAREKMRRRGEERRRGAEEIDGSTGKGYEKKLSPEKTMEGVE